MNDLWNAAGNGGNLNCSANDAFVCETPGDSPGCADPTAVAPPEAGFWVEPCIDANDTGTLNKITFTISTPNAASRQDDVSVFVETGLDTGLDGALRGECLHFLLPEDRDPAFCNPPGLTNQDPPGTCSFDGDGCEDLDGFTTFTLTNVTLGCNDFNSDDGEVDISTCLSFAAQQSDFCADLSEALPQTKSKCKCQQVRGGSGAATPELDIDKICNTEVKAGRPTTCVLTLANLDPVAAASYISVVDSLDAGDVGEGTISNISVAAGDFAAESPEDVTIIWIPNDLGTSGVVDGPTFVDDDPPGGDGVFDTRIEGADFQNVPAGSTLTLTYTFTPDSGLAENETITNTACIYWDQDGGGGDTGICDSHTMTVVADTPVWLSSLRAYEHRGKVVVEWETATQVGTLGFELYRQTAGGEWVRVSPEPLRGLIEAPLGGLYRYVDGDVMPSTRPRYKLVEIGYEGTRRAHGPFEVEVDWQRARFPGPTPQEGFSLRPHDPSTLQLDRLAAARRERGPRSRRGGSAPGRRRRAGGSAFANLSVRADGLYRASSAEIAAALGTSERSVSKSIQRGRLRLTNRGQEVAWRAAGTGIEFFGESIDSNYTLDNVYVLREASGTRMGTASGGRPFPAPGGSFQDSLRLESDVIPLLSMPADVESDYWYWDFVIESDPTYGARPFTFDLPNLAAGGDASVWVRLRGASRNEHRAILSVNGQEVGTAEFIYLDEHTASFDIDAATLMTSGNVLTVAGPGAPSSQYFIDGFRITYPSAFRARNDQLQFTAGTASTVTVEGFLDPAISLYDITDQDAVRLVTDTTLDGVAGNYRVSFVPADPAGRYLAVSTGAVRSPTVEGRADANLAAQSADYVVLTPAMLAADAQELISYRSSEFDALLVELQSVFDTYSFGIVHPQAIRDFVSEASSEWSRPLTYLTLAGSGSVDYRDLFGAGGNLLPPAPVSTDFGIFASDLWYGDVDGDGTPDVTVARIPALTGAEISAYAAKLEAAETTGGAWRTESIHAADDLQEVDFAAESSSLEVLFPSFYNPTPIHLGVDGLTLAQARQDLIDRINQGVSKLDYVGHSAIGQWAEEGLLTVSDVAGLSNGEMQPLMTSWTCNINRFELAWLSQGLGAAMVLHGAGGAVGVLAPSGLAANSHSTDLGNAFFTALFGSASGRVGDALIMALRETASPDSARSLRTYTLLGDAALRSP